MCDGNCKHALDLYHEINGRKNVKNEDKQIKDETKECNNYYPSEHDDIIRAPDKHFNQALIHDMDDSNFLHSEKIYKKEKNTKIELGGTFDKLFSPPKSLICSLSFNEVRKKSKEESKFILVNIQNSEFDSMRLNRDIWNNEIIQEIIKDFFIFWLKYDYDQEALNFMNIYKVNKLPYICVLCKRTARKLKVWNTKHFLDPICAQSQLYEFIEMVDTNNNMDNDNKNNSLNIMPNEPEKYKTDSDANDNDNKLYNTTKEIKYIEENKKDIDKNIYPPCSLDLSNIKKATKNADSTEKYNKINNQLSELHKLRLQRLEKK